MKIRNGGVVKYLFDDFMTPFVFVLLTFICYLLSLELFYLTVVSFIQILCGIFGLKSHYIDLYVS